LNGDGEVEGYHRFKEKRMLLSSTADDESADEVAATASRTDPAASSPRRVAYIMSRFPKLTETFVLFEMLALENLGVHVEVFPLLRARNSETHPEGAGLWTKFRELFRSPTESAVMHPEAEAFVARAHFMPFFNLTIAGSQLYLMCRKPLTYFHVLWTLIRANWGSANFLLGSLVMFPKCAHFARLMRELEIQHIHAHFSNHPAAAAYIVGRLSGIPYSFTGHGSDLQVDQHMLCEKVAGAKHVVAISKDSKRLIESTCGPAAGQRVTVIHCGVDTSVFDGDRGPESAASKSLQIMCVGTLYEVKGHQYLIEACRLLAERNISFSCELIGTGPLLSELQQQVSDAGLGDSIQFAGRQTRGQIAQRLKTADVLVAPSVPASDGRREGIPVVLMEAMASRVAVVASELSGSPELITHGETGWLVAPRDAVSLANTLQMLADDRELRQRLGYAGREQVLKEFDLNRNAQRLAELFFAGDRK
jgi:colanic acid/amylovoran biosynthesis glycosyltransferase